MTSIDFSIENWQAWSPQLTNREQWSQWVNTGSMPNSESKPDLSAFPAMLRRRLSPSGKMAMHSLLAMQQDDTDFEHVPAVFCSQHGEVKRSVKLLNAIAQSEPLSPTEFSLSVHNAVAGVYGIGLNRRGPVTAISGGPKPVIAALSESFALASEYGQGKVICIFYDQFLPPPYTTEMDECPMELALALQLSIQPSQDIGFPAAITSTPTKPSNPSYGLSVPGLLRFLVDDAIYLSDVQSRLALERKS